MRFEGNFIVIFMLFLLILWLKPIEVQIEALEPYEKLENAISVKDAILGIY